VVLCLLLLEHMYSTLCQRCRQYFGGQTREVVEGTFQQDKRSKLIQMLVLAGKKLAKQWAPNAVVSSAL
jgi:hypothetical protein